MSTLNIIKEIEKQIGNKLKPCPPGADIMGYEQKGCFLLNSRNQITGLNLIFCTPEDLSFLKNCPV
jgi:hypothetical protein